MDNQSTTHCQITIVDLLSDESENQNSVLCWIGFTIRQSVTQYHVLDTCSSSGPYFSQQSISDEERSALFMQFWPLHLLYNL
jgi:hypothetical protein